VHVLHETECLAEAWASACYEADTRGELLGGCKPCRPRVASLCAGGDTSETSWSACECAALHKSAVRSWRPRLPGGVCTKAETSCPDLKARLSYTAQVWVRHTYATLSRALAASVCDVCSGHRPRTRRDGHGYMLVTGSSCAPARLEMHLQPSVQSASHAARVISGLCACTASDLAAYPGLRGKHTSRHARAVGS
jgi:hypothetical protein